MTYTDFLNNPINEGDEIVYAQSAYGGGAELHRAYVLKIVPLVPHRLDPASYYMREDQVNHKRPTYFRDDAYVDAAKRYVIQIEREKHTHWRDSAQGWQSGKTMQKYTIPHSQHVIVVPK